MEGHERGGTMKGQIGPVADQIYEIWNCTISLHEYLEESPNCVLYTYQTFVVNNYR